MASTFRFYHLGNLKDQLRLEQDLGGADCHKIPLSKILHTLGRKSFLQTVIWEKGATNSEYAAECSFYGRNAQRVDRLHFFSAHLKNIQEIPRHARSYGGFCDLRPESRSIIDAHVTQYSVIRQRKETYAYLCCSMNEKITITGGSKKPDCRLSVKTFPFAEKDRDVVMCSQAALLSLIQYWNQRKPGTFSVTDAIGVNRNAGVPDEVFRGEPGRGLTSLEVVNLFETEDVPYLILSYGDQGQPPLATCKQDLYGFVESGFPVLVAIEVTKDIHHALLFLGHTYDRNSWTAMADVGYFKPRDEVKQMRYHPNTTWISNFIVHDDNFGPYYFFPTERLERVFAKGFVVLPDPSIRTRPREASDAAFSILASEPFQSAADRAFAHKRFNPANSFWLKEFLKHLKVQTGDGLVLRPVILTGHNIEKRFKGHGFQAIVEQVLSRGRKRYYWYIELTWPDIYCHRQLSCGSIIIDPATKEPIFVHIPGCGVAWAKGQTETLILLDEDLPRPHHGERLYPEKAVRSI